MRRPEPWVVTCIVVTAACSMADVSYAIFAPFLPSFATARGISQPTVGLIFATPMVASFVCGPLGPAVTRRVGSRAAMCGSVLLMALSVLAFTPLDRLQDPGALAGSAISLRALQGLASAVFECAAGGVIMRAAPAEHVSRIVGWAEAARGLGAAAGPSLGGVLFEVGGWALPFCAVGASLLVMLPVLAVLPGGSVAPVSRPASLVAVARIPEVFGGLLAIAVLMIAIGFLDPTLEPELRAPPLSLSHGAVGLVFSMLTLGYGLLSVVAGLLPSRGLRPHLQLACGTLAIAAGYLALGPAPFLPLPQTTATALGAMAAIGGGCGLSCTRRLSRTTDL